MNTQVVKQDQQQALKFVVVDPYPIPTLADAYADYKRFKRDLSPITIKGYDQSMRTCFAKWLPLKITDITEDEVLTLHEKTSKTNSNYGEGRAQADRCFRTLRAVLNWSRHRYKDEHGQRILAENPVNILSNLKAWNKRKPRTTCLKTLQFPVWWKATGELRDRAVCDWLRFTALTGLRKEEGLSLTWEQVDFFERTIRIEKTKNGDAHELPLTDYLYALLMRRYKNRPIIQGGHTNAYVFWSVYTNKNKGRLSGSHVKCVDKITEYTGIIWSVHALRRGFAQAAYSAGVEEGRIKRLLNHRTALNHDVTYRHYLNNRDIESLRLPMQKITDYLLSLAGVDKDGAITTLQNEPSSHKPVAIAPKPITRSTIYRKAESKKEIMLRKQKPRLKLPLEHVKASAEQQSQAGGI